MKLLAPLSAAGLSLVSAKKLGKVVTADFTSVDIITLSDAGYTDIHITGLTLEGDCAVGTSCNFFQKLAEVERLEILDIIEKRRLNFIMQVEVDAIRADTKLAADRIHRYLRRNGVKGVTFDVQSMPFETDSLEFQDGRFTHFLAHLIDDVLAYDSHYYTAIEANPIYFSPSNIRVPDATWQSKVEALQKSLLGLCNTLYAPSYYDVSQKFNVDSCNLNEMIQGEYETYDNMFMDHAFGGQYKDTAFNQLQSQVWATGYYLQPNKINIIKPADRFVKGHVNAELLGKWQCDAKLGPANWQGGYINGANQDIFADVVFAEEIISTGC